MNCIVLAAGYATRLYPLTKNFPKPLLAVGEKTIIDWLLDDVDRCGVIDRYAVVTNARFAPIFDEWKEKKQKSGTRLSAMLDIVDDGTISNETRLGAVNDILFTLESLKMSGPTLVMAGDNVLEFSLSSFLDYARKRSASAAMRYAEPDMNRLRKCGVLEIAGDDRILSMEEKPAEPKSHWCAPPFYFYQNLTPEKIRAALAGGCGFDAPGNLLAYLCRTEPIYAYEMPGCRFDVGNLASYQRISAQYRGVTK